MILPSGATITFVGDDTEVGRGIHFDYFLMDYEGDMKSIQTVGVLTCFCHPWGIMDYIYGTWWKCRKCNKWMDYTNA